MSKLRTDFSLGFDSRGPIDDDAIGGTPVVRRDLLGPLERRIASPRPADSIMWKGRWIAPVIELRHVNVGGVDDAVHSHRFIIRHYPSALHAGSVVANTVDN